MSGSYLQAKQRYRIDLWGEGYFDIDADGFVSVNGADNSCVRLHDVLAEARNQGLQTPLLLRFSRILVDRVEKLASAFKMAAVDVGYKGGFTSVYPIKVNQQRHVVETLYGASTEDAPVGLEAGSKPELLAVLAISDVNTTIVCNGYKDQEYIRLALMGERMGRKVFIVVEKSSELTVILDEAKLLGVVPRIGVRARLSSISKGNWQNTGGEKSKFGLSAIQILDAVTLLKTEGMLSSLQMLHFHLGSQISNIRDIQKGMKEAARYFTELVATGAPITTVDVGGGLGVDYEGSQSKNYCSVNYSMTEYAHGIVLALNEACENAGLAHPDIITEAGRALTAHHAVLVSNVIGVDKTSFSPAPLVSNAPSVLKGLEDCWLQLETSNTLVALYHDVAYRMGEINEMYTHGVLSLQQKAQGEQLYYSICKKLSELLDENTSPSELTAIREKLADKLFVNFSLFQSMPDVWGINQVFPIMPIRNLNKPLTRNAIIQDITCDSDGRIDQYVDSHGLSNYLVMPEEVDGQEECLAMFMVGAYQEILGDMHNLFGGTCSVDVLIGANGEFELQHGMQGGRVDDSLRHVNFDPTVMLQTLHEKLLHCDLSSDEQSHFLARLKMGLEGSTYFG